LTGGAENLTYNTTNTDLPVSICLTHNFPKLGGDFRLNFNFAGWHGIKTSAARMFGTIPKFIDAIKTATHARLTYHIDGENLSAGGVDLLTLKISKFDDFHRLYMLYTVVNHYKIDPIISLDAATDWEDVEILYYLIQGRTHGKTVNRGLSFKATIKANGLAQFLKPFNQGSNDILLESDFWFDVHGTQVARPNTRCRIDKMEVVNIADLQKRKPARGGTVEIVMRSCAGAVMTFS
jgi:hypothetical protein